MTRRLQLLIMLPMLAAASSIHADWTQVTALDLPLTKLSTAPALAKAAMKSRFEAQIGANQAFLREFPNDPHTYESKVRLAVAQARLGSLEHDPRAVDAALKVLMALEKQAPDETRRAEAMFRRISLQWQNLGSDPDQRRERALASAENFARDFPRDRRAPRLLAEAASLCDNHPEEKRLLVEKALSLSSDETLSSRLRDDLKRLDQLGKPVSLQFRTGDGREISLEQERGKVVALVFWAAESAPSLVWMRDFVTYAAGIPSLRVIGVSLDEDQGDLDAAKKSLGITWPVAFDGKGWKNTIARRLGINVLPTLWLIDRRGCLQVLNARDNYAIRINELLRQK